MNIHGVELIDNWDMVVKSYNDNNKRFENGSIAIWKEVAKGGGTMLDIGAYSGIYSMVAAKCGATVYAFELNETIYNRMLENIDINQVSVFTKNCAIGDKSGFCGISKTFDTSSAAHVVDGNDIEVKTIDSFDFENVNGIKIDVEGFEKNVLLGAIETIKKNKPLIISEALTDNSLIEQKAILENIGYTSEKIDKHNVVWRCGTASDYWKIEGLLNIVPTHSNNPEGFNVVEFVKSLFNDGETITDFGCGIGRISSAFDSEKYYGYDINEKALSIASINNPGYEFGNKLYYLDAVLFYTVLLHIPDSDMDSLISSISSKKVVVAEIMGRDWRRDGSPPVFNRNEVEYISMFESHGFKLTSHIYKPYNYYKDTNITFLVFEK